MIMSILRHRECNHPSSGQPIISANHAWGVTPASPHLQRRQEQMLANGWCPHHVRHLSRLYNFQTFSYLATLKRTPQRLVDHAPCAKKSTCIAYNTTTATYTTRHTTDDCICTMVGTPYHDLVRIIRGGGIPLVSIDENPGSNQALQLRVHARSAVSRYIAISHVWADGLGNPSENALPLCQIKRLHASLMSLQGAFGNGNKSALFWMDTLCIPVGSGERSLRLLQIDKMASIYHSAVTSLVLDAELMVTAPDDPASYSEPRTGYATRNFQPARKLSLEARARIACSVWMSRSWTLQEGVLPPSISVQFMGDVVILGRAFHNLDTYGERFADGRLPSDRRSALGSEAGDIVNSEPGFVASLGQNSSSLVSRCECIDIHLQHILYRTFFTKSKEIILVWNELSGRSSTMTVDVPIIITNALDLDNRSLLMYHDSAEMFQAIFLSLRRIPMSLLFNSGPRKIGNHQNRWVPAQVGADTLTVGDWLTVRPDGLRYRYSPSDKNSQFVIFIVSNVISLGSRLHLYSESEDTIYTVDPPSSGSDDLNPDEYVSTCIFVQNILSDECTETRKGACFYIRSRQENTPRKDVIGYRRLWPRKVRPNEFELVFHSSIRLKEQARRASCERGLEQLYILDPVKEECDIKINYDPIPGFKPLNRRRRHFFNMLGPFVLILFAGWTVFIIFVGAWFLMGVFGLVPDFEVPLGATRLWFLIFIALWFAGLIPILAIAVAFQEMEAWRYRRSFTAIATNRPPEGSV